MSKREPLAISATVATAVDATFAPENRAPARDLVASYAHNERERVQLAALILAGGELGVLADVIQLANADYRDVLAYADNAHLRSPEAKAVLCADFVRRGVTVPKPFR
jgi:hypothetical protein